MDARGSPVVAEPAPQGAYDPTSSVCMGSSTILLGVDISGSTAIASGPLTASFETRADHPFPGADKARWYNATEAVVRVCKQYLLVGLLCLCNLPGQATNDLSREIVWRLALGSPDLLNSSMIHACF